MIDKQGQTIMSKYPSPSNRHRAVDCEHWREYYEEEGKFRSNISVTDCCCCSVISLMCLRFGDAVYKILLSREQPLFSAAARRCCRRCSMQFSVLLLMFNFDIVLLNIYIHLSLLFVLLFTVVYWISFFFLYLLNQSYFTNRSRV